MKRLLIANRGEIAIRIANTVHDMGIEVIGIYSEDDQASLHLRHSDTLVALNGIGARAYLDIDQIVKAAVDSGADAIHPGYGFLSENPDFTRAVEAAGLLFIGPTPESLQRFGDKSSARQLAMQCNVPVLHGSENAVTVAEAQSFFSALDDGKAMIIKAVSGGGGRGMRIVRKADEVAAQFERASSEAQAAFGAGDVYVEEYLPQARHIEVQILGDGQGGICHFGERDCSLQRQHQKIIEIAPSPDLDAAVRDAMIAAALAMAKAIKYRGLGTIEFLLEPVSGTWAFIEGNARIQVEHTVTEQVYQRDLVALQLAVTSGQTLDDLELDQDNIGTPNGYAIQIRLNMETMKDDGSARPSGGVFSRYDMPAGLGVRVDGYGYAGYATNPSFDSLIAKLIVHSRSSDFSDAVTRADAALQRVSIEGVKTNLAFLQSVFSNPRVRANDVSTEFIDTNIASLLPQTAADAPPTDAQRGSADPLAVLKHGQSPSSQSETPQSSMPDEILPDGITRVLAPMHGVIVSSQVAVDDEIWVGKTVAIMEAMKMEHEIKATASGIVQKLNMSKGDTVFEDHPLLYLKAQEVAAVDDGQNQAVDLDHIRPDLQEVLDRIGAGHDENRPETVAKRKGRGHRTARENIEDLCDDGSFVEYGSVVLAAQRRRRSLEDLISRTTGDGMVCGLGHVNGDQFPEDKSRVMAMTYDYMVLAGTQGALNHYKKDRMFEIAKDYQLPTILFAEGGGGRPGDTDAMGIAGLDCLAFNYFAQLSALVPLIGITNGRSFAGNAVLLGCCDVIIATEGSNIGIGGPAMIEGGGLGVFSPDDVGPMDVQVANGVVDIAVKDEAEAVAVAQQYLSYFQGSLEKWDAPDARVLRHIVPENRLRWYDMRHVIEGIADIGSVLELREQWAPGIITSFIRIEGRPVGIIANDPSHLSGAIDAPGADKGARFMQLCDAFDIPIVTLIDCPGIMVGPEIEKTALVRHTSRMMVIGANVDTPLISVVIRKGYGLGAQAMAGGSFKAPMLTVAWPTGEFGGMGLEGAVKLGFRKELEAIEDPVERQTTYDDMVAKSYQRGKAVNMASHFEIDGVIDPIDTRQHIMAMLKALPPKPVRTGKKRPNIDTW